MILRRSFTPTRSYEILSVATVKCWRQQGFIWNMLNLDLLMIFISATVLELTNSSWSARHWEIWASRPRLSRLGAVARPGVETGAVMCARTPTSVLQRSPADGQPCIDAAASLGQSVTRGVLGFQRINIFIRLPHLSDFGSWSLIHRIHLDWRRQLINLVLNNKNVPSGSSDRRYEK